MAKKTKRAAYGLGIVAYGRKLVTEGKTNQQVLAAIHKKFPTSTLKITGVAWIRNDLRRKGVRGVKTNRELAA